MEESIQHMVVRKNVLGLKALASAHPHTREAVDKELGPRGQAAAAVPPPAREEEGRRGGKNKRKARQAKTNHSRTPRHLVMGILIVFRKI